MFTLFKNKKYNALLSSSFFASMIDSFLRFIFLLMPTYALVRGNDFLALVGVSVYLFAFVFGALAAGPFCDAYSKLKVLKWMRGLEIAVVVLMSACLMTKIYFIVLISVVLVGFCTGFSSIVNRVYLKEIMDGRKLLNANAFWRFFKYIAFTLSMFGVMYLSRKTINSLSLILVALSIISFLFVAFLKEKAVAKKEGIALRNPLKELIQTAFIVREKRDLHFVVFSFAFVSFLMGVVALSLKDYLGNILSVDDKCYPVMLIAFFVGSVIGAFLCSFISSKNKQGFLAPVSILGFSVFLFDIVLASQSLGGLSEISSFLILGRRFIIDAFFLGLCASFFVVPFYTLLQKMSNDEYIGRIFSYVIFISFLAIICAFSVYSVQNLFDIHLPFIIGSLGVMNLFFAFYAAQLLPVSTRRRVFKKILKLFFKARIEGLDKIASLKRGLIIPNHTSFIDALLISAFIDRKIVFSLNDRIAKKSWVRFFCQLMEVKALDANSPMAVKTMMEELKKDQLCMIFIENIVEDANAQSKMYEGPALMAYKAGAPIIPIQIDGAEHTIFSRIKRKSYVQWFPKISMKVWDPVYLQARTTENFREERSQISTALYDLMSELTFATFNRNQTLPETICDTMRGIGRNKYVMEDTTKIPLKFKHVFLRSFVLGALMDRALQDTKTVGVLLPTSNACVLTMLGLQCYGRVPAMLNMSAGPNQVVSACRTAELSIVLTSKKVVSLAKIDSLIDALKEAGLTILYLEDLKEDLRLSDKLAALWGMYHPKKFIQKHHRGAKPMDPAIILFTSGSEGLPKGVMLSHYNILSNCFQAPTRVNLDDRDTLLCCLPMFHSFGVLGGCYLPLVSGARVVLYPTPLHYRIIPELCARSRATVLFSTDTFLSAYAKCANLSDFNSLRLVVCGAEKLKDATREIWSEKFGLRVIEGYGATECSPIISANSHIQYKKGSVGRLWTTMKMKLKEIPGIKDGAELVVWGPNIMMGYLKADKPGVLQPPADGWYETGDIVTVDENGFITIIGRSKRFAKIAGEMVSLGAVEEVISKNWPDFVHGAVNIPDDKKGEKVVLITTCADISSEALIEAFQKSGMSELCVPKKIIFTVNPPLLGSGKFDYVKAKEMALADDKSE